MPLIKTHLSAPAPKAGFMYFFFRLEFTVSHLVFLHCIRFACIHQQFQKSPSTRAVILKLEGWKFYSSFLLSHGNVPLDKELDPKLPIDLHISV